MMNCSTLLFDAVFAYTLLVVRSKRHNIHIHTNVVGHTKEVDADFEVALAFTSWPACDPYRGARSYPLRCGHTDVALSDLWEGILGMFIFSMKVWMDETVTGYDSRVKPNY